MDTLSNALSTIINNELRNKRECIIAPASKLVGQVLRVMQRHGYVGEFEFIDDGRFGKFKVQLFGRINRCGAIRPRYATKVSDLEFWEKQFLPAKDVGIIVISTQKDILSHKETRDKRLGGRLLAFVY